MKHVPRVLAIVGAVLSLAAAAAATDSASVAARKLDAAEAAFSAKDWESASTLFRELAEENPFQGRFWYRLGSVEYNRKRYREAIAPYERSAALGYNVGTCHYNRACCLALLGEAPAAIDAIEQAIRAGLRDREDLLRTDSDLDGIRATPEFRARILPAVEPSTARADGWRIDLEYLTRRVAETHYDPFRYISREEWDKEIERMATSLPTASDHEVVVALMQLLVRINDGHTALELPGEGPLAFHVLPVQFHEFKDGLFVRAASREYERLVGKRVVKIGNLPAKEAMERVATTVSRDNTQQIRWMTPYHLACVEVLDALGVSKGLAAVTVTVVDARGRESSTSVVPVPLYERYQHGRRGLPDGYVDAADHAGGPVPLWRRDYRRLYTLEYLEEPRVVYACLRAVMDDSTETLADFTSRLFDFIDSHPVEALVIDVRENHGGNNFLARPLAQRIETSARVNRHGKLFVVIGCETFSACQNFCNWLDRRTEVIFVGEPTGSKPNFVGEGNNIVLPYSGLVANASSRLWQDSVSEDARVWIAPDLVAQMTSDDYLNNRDPALAAILKYLQVTAGH
jgi:tetratricopeptide (TPR) repeat protein